MNSLPLNRWIQQTAARGAHLLTEEAREAVGTFLLEQCTAEGAFAGRDGKGDLYYTLFGWDALLALGQPFPSERLQPFLASFADGQGLDYVHLVCLARCRARIGMEDRILLNKVMAHIQKTADPYDTFMAVLALEDHGGRLERDAKLLRSLADDPQQDVVPVLSAEISLRYAMGQETFDTEGDRLLACCVQGGGFSVHPRSPDPDLLSTATALFALRLMDIPVDRIRASALDFIENCWQDAGGFSAHPQNSLCDTEYTFYGLLGLGALV